MNLSDSLAMPELKRTGPITYAVQRRALFTYLSFVFSGWLLAMSGNPFFGGFGLGLFFPGSGFIFTGAWLWLALTLALFAVSFLIWFACGNILAPVGVWLVAAILAGSTAAGASETQLMSSAIWLVPGVVAALAIVVRLRGQRTYKKQLATQKKRNVYLSETLFEPVPAPEFSPDYWQELSLDYLKALKFNLNRGLQPVDEFNGFEWHEYQYQFAAVRYQLNNLNYGLHLYQQRYAPNFHGYLNEAQRNLIEKALDKRVWGYWKSEALWGQLTTDFDPIKKENVMLSGWWGVNVAAYTSNTGDQRYLEPGSLTFRYNDVEFPYDLHSISEAVHRNYDESEWCLYACEPNWVYNMCNESGMTLLKQHDRLFDTSYYSDLEARFFENIENEFSTVDGRVIALRSQRLGFSVPLLTSPFADASFGYLTNAMQPKLAQRVWKILRTDLARIKDDGSVEIDTQGWDELDMGNYKPSNISTYFAVRMFAQEMGDSEFAGALEKAMERQHKLVEEGGTRYFAGGSVIANAFYVLGNLMQKNSWSDLISHPLPEHVMQGPLLNECRYPDVLVAKAVSLDGKRLDLVLYPGSEQHEQELGFSRLEPDNKYAMSCSGEKSTQVADSEGNLRTTIQLAGRTEVTLTPVGM